MNIDKSELIHFTRLPSGLNAKRNRLNTQFSIWAISFSFKTLHLFCPIIVTKVELYSPIVPRRRISASEDLREIIVVFGGGHSHHSHHDNWDQYCKPVLPKGNKTLFRIRYMTFTPVKWALLHGLQYEEFIHWNLVRIQINLTY